MVSSRFLKTLAGLSLAVGSAWYRKGERRPGGLWEKGEKGKSGCLGAKGKREARRPACAFKLLEGRGVPEARPTGGPPSRIRNPRAAEAVKQARTGQQCRCQTPVVSV